jgi:DNA-binding transcriptional LysR family regulator
MNVTLRQLRAFLAVARTRSFTLAAESLYITQSALSGLIKELEQVLGLRLVDRSTRRVHLTEVGQALQPLLENILQELDGALNQVAQHQMLRTGVVRVAASQLLASTLLPDIIAAYQARYPDIRVKLVDTAVDNVMARVFAGEVDFGIGPEREPNSDISSRSLFDGPFMAVFPPGHALERLKSLRWSDLKPYPVIALQGQFIERLLLDLRGADSEPPFTQAHEVGFMSTALSMVNAGLGVSLCIAYAGSLVSLYGLKMRPLAEPEIRRTFEIFTRKGRSLAPAAQNFLDFLELRVRGLPYLR